MADIEKTPARGDWPDLFARRFGDWFADWPRWPETWRGLWETQMKVEELTEGNELVVRAELPGIDPDKDVEIQVTDHTLRIRAERRRESTVEEKGHYRSEFQYGSFSRSIPLPSGVTEDDVKASYKDGILEVRLPVDTKAAASTKIPIRRV